MGQQEYDAFKDRLREWMESHAGEYDAFEAGMNRRDDAGYQTILAVAMGFAPEYAAIVNRRVNRGPDGGDTSDIEMLFAESGLAGTLTGDSLGSHLADNLPGEFEDIRKESVVPVMLCWLYFGQSFERMVERGEELRRNPEIPYHEKMLIAQTIKLLVDQSIELGLRTKEDWVKQHSWMKLADSEDMLGSALATDEKSDEKRKRGRPGTAMPLPEMFTSAVRGPNKLMGKIGDYLTTKHTQIDIAQLKIALDELRFIVSPVDIKAFRDALAEKFGPDIHIVHERGIQDAYKRLASTISTQGKRVADIGEDRASIDELKKFLRS